MEKAKVYMTSFRARLTESVLKKFARLLVTAGMDKIDFEGKYVAIKMHFGEPGNLGYLRPQYARVVADLVRDCGGKPFLVDCNTLYVGGRKNALDHMDSANGNGFLPMTTGCQVIIGDGLKGTDDVAVPVAGGEYCKEARIGRAVMDADIIISLNHFKGHEMAGIGGAIKNLGMGCGSRAGKMTMHAAGKPNVNPDACIGCGACADICAHDAPTMKGDKMEIDHAKCAGCGRCIGICPMDAIQVAFDAAFKDLCCKMVEYTKAVVDGRPHFHISIVNAVSPNCDCHAENDAPLIPDVGMFASFDPVALDCACAEACSKQARNAGTWIDDNGDNSIPDLFTAAHPTTNWRYQTEHGIKMGLGTDQYELICI